jgi:hypothetical protein
MWIDVAQNSDEWFNLRLGLITSSNFGKIMANYAKVFGTPAIEYAQKIALERVTGQKDESSSFSNGYMDRGHELEPLAVEQYEIENFVEVTNGGFHHVGYYGDSPDGNVGEDGCIEIKSVIPNTQWKRLKKGGIDLAYKWQVQGHLLIGSKKWCDFISYCPEMPESKQLHVVRVFEDEEMQVHLKKRLSEFQLEVVKNVKILNS